MSVSVDYLTKYLRDNPKDIISILENTGFYNISFLNIAMKLGALGKRVATQLQFVLM